jgi:hypothetical protein
MGDEAEAAGAGAEGENTGATGDGVAEAAAAELSGEDKLEQELLQSMTGYGTAPSTGSDDQIELIADDADDSADDKDDSDSKDEDAEGDKKPEDGADDKPEEKAEATGKKKGWSWKEYRNKRRELDDREVQLGQAYTELQRQRTEAQQYTTAAAEIRKLAATDPQAAARKFAELTGQPADDLYTGWTKARLEHGTEAEQKKPVDPAMAALQQRIDEMEARDKKNAEAAQQYQANAVHQRDCAQVLTVASEADGDNANKCPYLATMPKDARDPFIASAVNVAYQLQQSDGVPRDHLQVASTLDNLRQEELRDQLQALHDMGALQAILPAGTSASKGEGSKSEQPSSAGQPGRGSSSKRGNKGLGNSAGAQTSAGARKKSQAELDRELEKALVDSYQG